MEKDKYQPRKSQLHSEKKETAKQTNLVYIQVLTYQQISS